MTITYTTTHKVLVLTTALLAVGTPLTLTAAAEATHPGDNGRIVFQREDEDGFTQIWTANPDLGAPEQLTDGEAHSGWGAWSPDGARIAFDSDRSDPDRADSVSVNDVFTMSVDGTDVRKVTDSVGFSGDPAYSPDGSMIAFDADRGVVSGHPGWPAAQADLSIYVVRPDGTDMRRVTTPPSGSSDTEPRFSPDGSKLVFTRFRGVGSHADTERFRGDSSALFTVNLDGTGLRRITGWGLDVGQADWSPNGRLLVFEVACCRLGAGGIFTVSSNGGAVTTVVNGHGVTGIGNEQALQVDGYYDPVWSPDGTKIIAGREFLGDDGSFKVGLISLDADGSNLHWVSPLVDNEHQPDWGTSPLH
jgi:Tol biopolymer transport system component